MLFKILIRKLHVITLLFSHLTPIFLDLHMEIFNRVWVGMKKNWLWKGKREKKFTLHFNIRRHLKNICAIYMECWREKYWVLRNPTLGCLSLFQFGYFSILEIFPRITLKVSVEKNNFYICLRVFLFKQNNFCYQKIF